MSTKFSVDYQTVVSSLPLLTREERRKVHSILRKLDSSLEQKEAQKITQELYRWSPLTYSVLADEIRLRQGSTPKQLHFLPKSLVHKIDDLSRELDIDLAKLIGHEGNQADRVNWYRMYAKLVARYLTERQVPVTIKTLVQNYDKFSSLIDRAYPGYLDSGIFVSLVLRGSLHP